MSIEERLKKLERDYIFLQPPSLCDDPYEGDYWKGFFRFPENLQDIPFVIDEQVTEGNLDAIIEECRKQYGILKNKIRRKIRIRK